MKACSTTKEYIYDTKESETITFYFVINCTVDWQEDIWVFIKFLKNEWNIKYSESPLKIASESGFIGALAPNTSHDTAI